MSKSVMLGVAAIVSSVVVDGVACGSAAQAATRKVADPAPYLMDHSAEIALARTAGPSTVSSDASVMVLGQDGTYQLAAQGNNGWTCLVTRSWSGPAAIKDNRRVWGDAHFEPESRAPQCFNAAAMPVVEMHKLAAKHFMAGVEAEEVDAAIGLALQAGTLEAPRPGAMSYMLSKEQLLSRDAGNFRPHLMLYTPYAKGGAYGRQSDKMPIPFVTDAGTAWAVTIVMFPTWSDGSPAQGH